MGLSDFKLYLIHKELQSLPGCTATSCQSLPHNPGWKQTYEAEAETCGFGRCPSAGCLSHKAKPLPGALGCFQLNTAPRLVSCEGLALLVVVLVLNKCVPHFSAVGFEGKKISITIINAS